MNVFSVCVPCKNKIFDVCNVCKPKRQNNCKGFDTLKIPPWEFYYQGLFHLRVPGTLASNVSNTASIVSDTLAESSATAKAHAKAKGHGRIKPPKYFRTSARANATCRSARAICCTRSVYFISNDKNYYHIYSGKISVTFIGAEDIM